MAKNGKAKTTEQKEAALDAEVRAWIVEFRAKNDGVEPTRKQVQNALNRRRDHVLKAIDRIEEAEASERAKLEGLPDIPQILVTQGNELVERLWVAAAEISAPIIASMRQTLSDQSTRHKRQQAENAETLTQAEDELEVQRARADAAESANSDMKVELERMAAELTQAHAQLEAREDLMRLIRVSAPHIALPEAPDDDLDRFEGNADRIDTPDLPFGPAE